MKANEEGMFKIPGGIETNKKGSYLFSSSKVVVWKQAGRYNVDSFSLH